jgi:hypothetical protein
MTALVVPAFAWYWRQSGDSVYQQRGDELFAHALDADISYSGKIFAQNYRWTFDYVRWRSGGTSSAWLQGSNPATVVTPILPLVRLGQTVGEVTIEWTTTRPASSQVEFGLSPSYGTSTDINLAQSMFHSFRLSGLRSDTKYHYRVRSVESDGTINLSLDNEFVTSPLLVESPPGAVWFDRAWRYRQRLSVDATKLGGSVSHFPVLVDIEHPRLATLEFGGYVLAPDGGDIAFAAGNGAPLSFEVESYDKQKGRLVAWVRVPSLHPWLRTENSFYVYYGSAGTVPKHNVWLPHYRGVWHLEGVQSGRDSSDYGNHAIANTARSAAGKIRDAVFFDSLSPSSLVDIPPSDSLTLNSGPLTIQAWVNPSYGAAWSHKVFSSYIGVNRNGAELTIGRSAKTLQLGMAVGATTATTTISIPRSVWTHVVGVFDGSLIALYINGQKVESIVGGPLPELGIDCADASARPGHWLIGRSPMTDSYFSFRGAIDEVRVLSSALSSGWVFTEYANQSNPKGFVQLAEVEMLR